MKNRYTQLWVIKLIIFVAFIAMNLPYSILPILFIQMHFYSLFHLSYILPQSNLLFVMSIYPLGMFLGSYILGILSDKVGKKPILLTSLGLAVICQILCGFFVIRSQLIGFIMTRFLAGFFEGNSSIARASIANLCLTEEECKKHLGQANVALTLGWIIGPLLGASLSSIKIYHGFLLPFIFSAVLTGFTFFFSYVYFEEPTIQEHCNAGNREHIAEHVTDINIIILLIVSFFLLLGVDAFYIFLPVYFATSIHAPPIALAISVGIIGSFNILSNIILLPKLHHLLDTRKTIIVCSLLLSLYLILFVIFKANYMLFLILPFIGINIALIAPNLSSYISMKLKQNKQGTLMGILLSQRTLGTIFLSLLFAISVQIDLKLPFLLGSLFLLSGLVLFYVYSLFNNKKIISADKLDIQQY